MKSALGDERYGAEHTDYDGKILEMTDWIKLAKKSIADKRKLDQQVMELKEQTERNAERAEIMLKEQAQLEIDEKHFGIKIKQLLKTVDIINAVHLEEVESHIAVLKDLLGQFGDLHHRLEVVFGEEYNAKYGDAFETQTSSLTDQINLGIDKLKMLRQAKEDAISQKEKDASKKVYNEKVALSGYIFEEIKLRCTRISLLCQEDLKPEVQRV